MPTASTRRHDPYRPRNWIAGLALVVAVLSVPGLAISVAWDLPAITRGVFGGAPIAIALLAVAASVRRGTGMVLSIVAAVLATAVVVAGFVAPPELLGGVVHVVEGLFRS